MYVPWCFLGDLGSEILAQDAKRGLDLVLDLALIPAGEAQEEDQEEDQEMAPEVPAVR